jgi:enoyl-CoA hydratase/carnithine racemase
VSDTVVVSGPAGGVACLTLNRPERRNALSMALRDEVSDALERLAGDQAVRSVILTGEGDVFCAGFDLDEFTAAEGDPVFGDRLWASSDRFHHACLRFPLPLVAAVNGPAVAGGFDLAVLCDVRLAAVTAWFSHPERERFNVVYSPLHELVGGAVARDLVLTGRRVDADEALRLHLVSQVTAPEELLDAACETARRIALAPRSVLVATKAKMIARAGIDVSTATLDL